ncbi:MAG: ribosome maturation factor RimM [Congregibacter sp.]
MRIPGDATVAVPASNTSVSNPANEAMLLVGTINGVYGIKGWVKVHALTDPAENFLLFGRWFTQRAGAYEPIKFTDGRVQGKGLIAKLDGVDDRTGAEALRGTQVWIHAEQLPELEDGDFYWHQLQGLKVVTEYAGESVLLGVVDHLLATGGNDVLVVLQCEGSTDDRERLIPYVPDTVVTDVDTQAGVIRVDWHPDD